MKARVILLGEAEAAYRRLNEVAGALGPGSDEARLLRSIEQKIAFLKENPFYGDNVPKRLIPRSYRVPNLWRVALTGHWRLLYTIKGDAVEVICFVLDILDHKRYDKRFGYRKR